MGDLERFIAGYRANLSARSAEVVRPDHRRMLVLTAAFTPMIAVAAAIPVTMIAVVIAELVANATSMWVGIIVLVVAAVGMGYATARWAVGHEGVPATRGWRRWLPLASTIVVVAACLAEIATGGRAPTDPAVALWCTSILWLLAFFPLATGTWGPARRASWAVGPAVTFVAIVFVWTQGFFWLRFRQSVTDLGAVAQQVAEGNEVPNGTHAGGFVVHYVDRGRIGGDPGCDVGFWITGWHEQDTRYIAHCVGDPRGGFTHLDGDWWELEDKQPPSSL